MSYAREVLNTFDASKSVLFQVSSKRAFISTFSKEGIPVICSRVDVYLATLKY
jgi:hypothetical protein